MADENPTTVVFAQFTSTVLRRELESNNVNVTKLSFLSNNIIFFR